MRDKDLIQEKKQKLIEMTAKFCNEYLDNDYKQLCEKLIQKMSCKRNVPFLSGKIEVRVLDYQHINVAVFCYISLSR